MRTKVTFGRSSLIAGLVLCAVAAAVSVLAGSDRARPTVDVSGAQPTDATPNWVFGFGGGAGMGVPDVGRQAGIAPTPSGNGYWVVNRRGAVFFYGDAPFMGDLAQVPINRPIVGIAAVPPTLGVGWGYWLVAADGAVYAFGGARFFGDAAAVPLNQPIVGIAATRGGLGYWLVASDGGVFTYGDAKFQGSAGNLILNQPIVGVAPGGHEGYWLVAADGGVFSYGEPFLGSMGGVPLVAPVVGMGSTHSGKGYWLAAADGGVFTFGGAKFKGSAAGGTFLPVVGMTPRPQSDGYWLLATPLPPVATFRVLGSPPPPPGTGFGKRVVYCNSCQRVWLIVDDTGWDAVVDTYLVSGRPNTPAPGFYSVQRRLNPGYTSNGVRLDHFVGFAWGNTTDIGFHAIPISPSGRPLQTEDELGQYRSHGCVRQAPSDAVIMWDFAPGGTTVVVTP